MSASKVQTETNKSPKSMKDLRFNKKVITARIVFVLVIILIAGIATQVVPQGEYLREKVDGHTVIVENSFSFIEGSPLPVWRWFTAPFEALVGDSAQTVWLVILCMLLMGGIMMLLDESKVLEYMVSSIIKKFGGDPFKLMYCMVFVMMLMGSTISFYSQAAVFLPLALGICYAIGWDCLMGMALSYTAIGMGFGVSMVNPYTVGIPQAIAGLPINSGLWLRAILFCIMYFIYTTFLRNYGKKILRDPSKRIAPEADATIGCLFPNKVNFDILTDKKIRNGAIAVFSSMGFVILYTISTLFISSLSGTTMTVMLLSLTTGAVTGSLLSGRMKAAGILKAFLHGFRVSAPGTIVIVLVMGVRQIIVNGKIMDSILYFAYNGIKGMNPYIAVLVILGITLCFEFVVGSATTKAFLLLPLLVPLGNMVGLTSQTIVQAYMFGDGFTNSFYPTATQVLLASSLLGIPLGKWYKWSWKLILCIVALVVLTLLFCVKINYGPY